MSLEQSIQALVAAVEANTAAMLSFSGATATATAAGKKLADAADKKPSTDAGSGAGDGAVTNKTPTAAEKKAAAAAKKAAEEKAKKSDEVTDERIAEVFGPLLAKTLDADTLASNKQFVATLNTHFGVTKLREVEQADRAKVIEWGLARAEDEDFEIPGADDEDDGV